MEGLLLEQTEPEAVQAAARPADRLCISPDAWVGRPQVRAWSYAAFLTIAAVNLCFYRLAGPSAAPVRGDEAVYAHVVDNMRASGDWWTPCFLEGVPFHDKPPLYFWLTCATYTWLADGHSAMPYRFWAAVCGVGCVLLTFLVGLHLGTAETGLLAGASLLLNHRFLLCLGARYGNLDTMTIFFVLAGVVYYLHKSSARPRWFHWIIVGTCIGAACMTKPPIVGFFFLGMLGLDHVLSSRGVAFGARLIGPCIGGVACACVAAPWHILQWQLWGSDFINTYVLEYMVHRAAHGFPEHAQGPLFYVRDIMQSSAVFHLAWPAVALGIVALGSGSERRRWSLLLLLTVSFVAAMSLSASKLFRYVYPAYPFLSVAVALMCLQLLPTFSARLTGRTSTWWWFIGAGTIVVLLCRDAKVVQRQLVGPTVPYAPMAIYDQALPALAKGDGCLALFQFPQPSQPRNESLGLIPADAFYARHTAFARQAATMDQLQSLVAERKPLVVILPPLVEPDVLARITDALRPGECRRFRSIPRDYPVMSFHGGFRALGIGAPMDAD